MSRQRQDLLRPLRDEERVVLRQVARARSEPASYVARAKMLLAVADGNSYQAAAEVAGRMSRRKKLEEWEKKASKLVWFGLGDELPGELVEPLQIAGITEREFRTIVENTVEILWSSFYGAADDKGSMERLLRLMAIASDRGFQAPPFQVFDKSFFRDGQVVLLLVKSIEVSPIAGRMPGQVGDEIEFESGRTGRHDHISETKQGCFLPATHKHLQKRKGQQSTRMAAPCR